MGYLKLDTSSENKNIKILEFIHIVILVLYCLLLDAFVVYTAARDFLIQDKIDWDRFGGGNGEGIPSFYIYRGDQGFCELLISVGFVVLFAILINYKLARKMNNIIRFYSPIGICFLNTVLFIIFEKCTGRLWPGFFGYIRTAPETRLSFAPIYPNNTNFMVDFVKKNILFLVIIVISLIIDKKRRSSK